MTTSALLRHGIDHLGRLRDGLQNWMAARDFNDLAEFRGMMNWRRSPDGGVYTRTNYLRILRQSAAS